ncbi:MAG TPA: hypothetical protein PLM06_07500 [Anaerolineae bacterium]|nr:hypothetical protein [Anaerolineae bacterium]
MEQIVQALVILVVALAVLLFFGPIVVIVSIIGNVEIGPLNVNLRNMSKLGRVILGIIGLALWLSVYIPLVNLARQELALKTPTPTPTFIPVITETSTPISLPSATPPPQLSQLTATPITGVYKGLFYTNGRPEWKGKSFNVTLTLSQNGKGTIFLDGIGQYNGPVVIQSINPDQLVIIFDDIDGDQIEATLDIEGDRLSGTWKYTSVYTATGSIDVSK